jgi:hypothetical protein
MKRYLISLCVVFFISGCGNQPKVKGAFLCKIDNYEIAQEEFEKLFNESSFGRSDTLESRKEFLSNLINQKLILQDAQSQGLDKDKAFLESIQRFWEQALLKIALEKKSREIAGSALVSDKAIEQTYNEMLKDGKTDKPYDQMYNQIKWEIAKSKETQMVNDWITQLNKKADIKINYDLLKQGKGHE